MDLLYTKTLSCDHENLDVHSYPLNYRYDPFPFLHSLEYQYQYIEMSREEGITLRTDL